MALSSFYFEEEPEIINGAKIPPITDEYDENFPSMVDRFFTRFYFSKQDTPDEEYLILFHSNRVCLICLSPAHIALKKGIKKISFDIGNSDRSKIAVKGKGKRGGMALQEDTALAMITCDDESVYKVPSCVRGKLIEVNERILDNPNLLAKEDGGYIAIILPKPEDCDSMKANLKNEEDYKKEKIANS